MNEYHPSDHYLNQKRVLLSIGSSIIGGGQRVFLSILDVFIKANCKITIVIPDGPLVDIIKQDYQKDNIYVLPQSFLGKLICIFKVLKRHHDIDFICTHLANCAFWFSIVNLYFGKKTICEFHNAIYRQEEHAIKKVVLRHAYEFICRNANAVVFCSSYLKRDFTIILKKEYANWFVINNGIEPNSFNANSCNRKNFTIGVIGRCSPEKGQIVFLKSLLYLKDLPIKSVLVGDGPDLSDLKNYVTDHDLEGTVEFWGWRTNIPEVIMNHFTIVVAPSMEDAFPLVPLEAFSVGVPVIGSNHGGLADIITDGVTGFLFQRGNSKALAECIRNAYQNKQAMAQMGNTAKKEFLEKYTLSHMQRNWMELLNKVFSAR